MSDKREFAHVAKKLKEDKEFFETPPGRQRAPA